MKVSKRYWKRRLWAVLWPIVMAMLALAFEGLGTILSKKEVDVHRLGHLLQGKVSRYNDALEAFKLSEYEGNSYFDYLYNEHGEALGNLASEDIYIRIYRADSLCFWNDNKINYFPEGDSISEHGAMLWLDQGVFYRLRDTLGPWSVYGLILVKRDYSLENSHLQAHFAKGFGLPAEIEIGTPQTYGTPVSLPSSKKTLFKVKTLVFHEHSTGVRVLTVICWVLAFLFLLRALYIYMRTYDPGRKRQYAWIGLLVVMALVLRWLMLHYRVPGALYSLPVFSPGIFAYSKWFPSLGDFLINAALIFYLAWAIWKGMRRKDRTTGFWLYVKSSIRLFVLFALFAQMIIMVRNLSLHSTISFRFYQILSVDYLSFVGLFIILLLFLAFALLVMVYVRSVRHRMGPIAYALHCLLVSLLGSALAYLLEPSLSSLFLLLTFFIFGLLAYYLYTGIPGRFYTYSRGLIAMSIFALLATILLLEYTDRKRVNEKKALLINLTEERDPVAEMLLVDVSDGLKNDPLMQSFFERRQVSVDDVGQYLSNQVFTGFWNDYELTVTLCRPADSLYLDEDYITVHCMGHFQQMINDYGDKLEGTDYYFLDNVNGRISYMGALEYMSRDSVPWHLFIELDSRPVTGELGYPALLLDKNVEDNPLKKRYDYAKYKDGELVSQFGDFLYSTNLEVYGIDQDKEFDEFEADGYVHMAYTIHPGNTIILSHPAVGVYDYVITFAYVFMAYFIAHVLILLVNLFPLRRHKLALSFRSRFQLSVLGLLLLFFLIIGGGTIYFTINQYEDKHVWNVSEKTSSVLVELQHKLGGIDSLTVDMAPEIFYYLIKFSNVFYSDINVYDLNGKLITGSRPEIFRRNLQNGLMDPRAFYQMDVKKKARYIHQEQIGNMEYTSAYVPFRNKRNEHLAYLNLPYFSRQEELGREIWNVVVGIINAYVGLIMLGIVLAVFVSGKLTGPLRLISQKIGRVKLGGSNEKIHWKGRDEIAGLVEQYNLMIDELAESAELLARGERETAWREMAKQIAHEIKNPLTPMKLSAQLLIRSWEDKDPDFEDKLHKLSQTLVSQIDNLSSIATAFSDFAKMPRPENRPVVITQVLRQSISLYEGTENIRIDTHIDKSAEKAQCRADKEQMLSVFNNLLQNAIQAIPEDRQGRIEVRARVQGPEILITFSDNGTGIPEQMRDKLFEPNFTTKSSGTGLGLAIVRNIINSAGGKVSLGEESGPGAEFLIRLPRIKAQ